jgi:acyl carrier protein
MSEERPALELIRELVARVHPEAGVLRPDSQLVDFGLNSADVAELVAQLEAAYDVELDEEDFADLETVGQLARYVDRLRRRP